MEAESHELEENFGVIGDIVVVEWRRLIGYDCSVLCCKAGEVFGFDCRLDEDYDSMFRVEYTVESIYVDEDGAGVLCLGGIEDVSIWTWTEIWQSCNVAFGREPLYRTYISVVICYLRCDAAGTGNIAVLMLRIGLAHYPEPKERDSTSER